MRYLRREPAVIVAVIAGVIQVLSAYLTGWTDEQQGALNAAVVLVAGLITAGMVSIERALPLTTGCVQALFAVALAFGWELTAAQQSAVLALVGAIGAAFVRTQVTVPVRPVETGRDVRAR